MNREGPTQGGGTQAGSGLERRMANLRSTYWRQYLTAHGSVNDLLMAYQEKPRLRVLDGQSPWCLMAAAAAAFATPRPFSPPATAVSCAPRPGRTSTKRLTAAEGWGRASDRQQPRSGQVHEDNGSDKWADGQAVCPAQVAPPMLRQHKSKLPAKTDLAGTCCDPGYRPTGTLGRSSHTLRSEANRRSGSCCRTSRTSGRAFSAAARSAPRSAAPARNACSRYWAISSRVTSVLNVSP